MPNKRKEKKTKLSSNHLQKTIQDYFLLYPKKRCNAKELIYQLSIDNNKDSVQYALDKLTTAGVLDQFAENKFGLYSGRMPGTPGVKKNNTAEEQATTEKARIRERFQKNGIAPPQKPYNPNREEKAAKSKSTYGRSGKMLSKGVLTGRVDMTRAGSAFIVVEGREEDIFVAQKNLHNALNRDIVNLVLVEGRGKRQEGKVTSIIEHATEQFIGTLRILRRQAVVIPDRMDLPFDVAVEDAHLNGALNGDKVVVKITDWNSKNGKRLQGAVVMVLGGTGTHDIEMKTILINNGFNILFPDDVIEQSENISDIIPETEISNRRDFRQVTTITIDPEDAKDFDDAISIQYTPEGLLEVGVHIADVTHYLAPGTPMDKEAYLRATSVYLVDRCCPMLPEKLSNGLCSLRPKEDKLTFSAVFTFDENHKIVSRWFGKTVIHSDRRFSYEEAQQILENGEGDFAKELKTFNELAKVLRKRRLKDGSINFEDTEVRFRLDEQGEPLEVYAKDRKDAHLLIEDYMLLANREVATYIHQKGKSKEIPFVYRIHDLPNMDKLEEFALFAKEIGFKMDISTPKRITESFNKLMLAAAENDALKMLLPLAIRTMAKAIYSSDNIGHYGLAFEYYSHFTSPIRRYADVLAHRILEQNLRQEWRADKDHLEAQCKHISLQERKASESERESTKYYQTVFLEKHVGQVFEGFISGMIDRGVFVTLKDNRCEGMVGFDRMGEVFDLDESRLRAVNRRSGKVLKMGDRVQVRILHVDRENRQIEMVFE